LIKEAFLIVLYTRKATVLIHNMLLQKRISNMP